MNPTPHPQRLPLPDLPRALPLYGGHSSRAIEQMAQHALGRQQLPTHTLMQRAGAAVFRLSAALAPHARRVWVVCGGGNNGGDGLLAAVAWQQRLQPLGGRVCVTWLGDAQRLPEDARHAWALAQQAGLHWAETPAEGPDAPDLAIDALFGLGLAQAVRGPALDWIERLQNLPCPLLCVDLPSGLCADHGNWHARSAPTASPLRHTLSLLTLKPGLFTHHGRQASGQIWFDDLGWSQLGLDAPAPSAWLHGPEAPLGMSPSPTALPATEVEAAWACRPSPSLVRQRQHGAHKGTHGSVIVIGGQQPGPHGTGMTGAAVLAARAALRGGAGRVYLGLLEPAAGTAAAPAYDPLQPELMLRPAAALLHDPIAAQSVTVCGCGGGTAVAALLAEVLATCPRLVLDADALNALAADAALQAQLAARFDRGWQTVLTPHPLEAARLLACSVAQVQADRLGAAQQLAESSRCVVVLKGSGTVVAAPGWVPRINPSGNALLASAGTGDVLAGLIGALLATAEASLAGTVQAAAVAVHRHGRCADRWPPDQALLCASDLLHRL
ncbi:bifunctional ADP-dependent NAD(P)H-hydrate dehydratase/NAD(P)H-hydrate epimerase [Serpentinimonas barnesii]|uniref:bifunctional ADP-dependent NAD(P)H-hydrate dehydratase/NAD(P)H-hydrate epimerase n=1 Tax=Serpentinimonas barnesii TaxID=1458427 RepID=UPI0004965501|nr:bifunctional ADP-dependent NAD(P)H-hydrate dehydratase/NAD(P)H-hydrate epimerase [Serpentinimonas barnesii]